MSSGSKIDRLIGRQAGRQAGWLVSWLVCWLVGWMVGWFGKLFKTFDSAEANQVRSTKYHIFYTNGD